MKYQDELRLFADYLDYKEADGCLDWQGYKTYRQRQETIDAFNNYIEKKKQPKSSLDETLEKFFKRLDNQLASMETGLSCIEEDVDYLSGLMNDVKNEIAEIKGLTKKCKEVDGNEECISKCNR